MKQIYLYAFFLMAMLFCATPATAQISEEATPKELTIEGLSVYPNPASGEKVYITSTKDKPKKVEIYNVLGKMVLSAQVTGKELNITSLESGIYIMKIKEGNSLATRKLVIR